MKLKGNVRLVAAIGAAVIPPTFPALPGQGWSVHNRPTFATRVAPHVSGREVRGADFVAPLWEFELTFDALAGAGGYQGVGAGSLQALMGLFLQCQGQFGTFLYTDPSDCTVTGQAIGTGDGATTAFVLQRTLGAFTEPVGWGVSLGAAYLNGKAAPAAALAAPNLLTFAAAPSVGAMVTADFTFAFTCRFLDDVVDFENFMAGLWSVQSLKFRSVRAT